VLLLATLCALVVGATLFGVNTYRANEMYVTTDNAQITGQQIHVGAMNAGRLERLIPRIGTMVHKGDVIAQVALATQVGLFQSGQPKLEFLGAVDTRIEIRAPVDGTVMAEPVAVGSAVAPGQTIVIIVDPARLFVTANVEETHLRRVSIGKPDTVHVDALDADVPGMVTAVVPATANTFSLLPSWNASGNFTKVTQLVPVQIAVDSSNYRLLLGANVGVKIRVLD
jgi:multidrug resistance efflux pump